MIQIRKITCLSKRDFAKAYPTLHWGDDGEWLVIQTPDHQICSLTKAAFPNSLSLLDKFQMSCLRKKEIALDQHINCLLRGTDLQHRVWKALLEIPEGTTVTYQDLALRVKNPKAVRAVANAVGANPISPLIPCHRVIRKGGELGGYYWGVGAKKKLLAAEGVDLSLFKER